ncbi:MAG: hypothetical protein LUE10_05185 [Alistipes sp.]|nr:hypothetical protein [Alistipes sp.]
MAVPLNKVPNIDQLVLSSPAAAMLNGKGYLFFKNGQDGKNYYLIYEPQKEEWSQKNICPDLLDFKDDYSISCQSYKDRIYFFWNIDKELHYTSFDGLNWDEPRSLRKILGDQGMQKTTHASSAVFNGLLYVFWNGSGENGLWYAKFNGSKWEGQYSHKKKIGTQGVYLRTSPGVCANNNFMFLSWTGSGKNGIWYSIGKPFFDWEKQKSIEAQVGTMDVNFVCSPFTYLWKDEVYVFWMTSKFQYMYTKANRYTMEFEPQRKFSEWIGGNSAMVPDVNTVPAFLMVDNKRYMIFYICSNFLYYAQVESQ